MVWCWAPTPLSAEGHSPRFYDGLRQRRLFGLAEGELLERLKTSRLSPRKRAELTLELSQTLAEHAPNTAGGEQDDLWHRAQAVLDDLLRQNPENPLRDVLEARRGIVAAQRAGIARAQMELIPDSESLPQQVREAAHAALGVLEPLERSLDARVRQAVGGRRPQTDGLSAYELRTLLYQVRFYLGVAQLERARSWPPGAPDRSDGILQAESWLNQLAGLAANDPLALSSRLLLAEAARMRGDFVLAERLLVQLEGDRPPRATLDSVVAQRVWLRLDQQDAPAAAEVLSEYRRRHASVPGELQFLNVRALAALWTIAAERGEPDLAAQLMQRLESAAAAVAHEVGGYWASRSQVLLATAREQRRFGPRLAALIHEARSLYNSGKPVTAAEAFDRASAAARQSDQHETAFELAYTRASILLHEGRRLDASRVLQTLVEAYPNDARAAGAHLLAAWALGQVYERQPTQENRLAYTEALHEHRRRFPEHATRHDATFYLALLEERRLQASVALSLYREIPGDHPRGHEALTAIARCHVTILDRLQKQARQDDDPARRRQVEQFVTRWQGEAVDELERLVAGFPNPPGPLAPWQADVCLRLAQLTLNMEAPDYARADALLERVFQSRPDPAAPDGRDRSPTPEPPDDATDAWRTVYQSAAGLRIVSLSGRGQFGEAEELVRELARSRSDDVLGILEGLLNLSAEAGKNAQFHVGQLALRAAGEVDGRREQLTAPERGRLELCLARAYAMTGQSRKAITAYERLLNEHPRDQPLRESLAAMFEQCGTQECYEQARQHWRRLEGARQPGSPDWLQARYHVALCTLELGEVDESAKLLAVTGLLYPDLGGDAMREKFESLQAQVAGRR